METIIVKDLSNDSPNVIIKDLSSDSPTVKVSEKGSKGRAGLVWRDAWVGTTDYYVGDVVLYEGSSWMNNTYTAANATNYPTTSSDWALFVEKGDKGDPLMSVSPTEPIGSCSSGAYATESLCVAGGGTWSATRDGDMWFDSSIGRLYARVSGSGGNSVWFDISGVVGQVGADNITVAASGNLAGGSLQAILERLENETYNSLTTPATDVQEGNLWYDETADQLKFFRDGSWELVAQKDSLSTGYDNISLNGGNF